MPELRRRTFLEVNFIYILIHRNAPFIIKKINLLIGQMTSEQFLSKEKPVI
jgi:hypothetical protein